MNSSEGGNKRLNNSESPLRRVIMDNASYGQRNNENASINANTAEKGKEMRDKAGTIDKCEQ